jgi:hypothetical protein
MRAKPEGDEGCVFQAVKNRLAWKHTRHILRIDCVGQSGETYAKLSFLEARLQVTGGQVP